MRFIIVVFISTLMLNSCKKKAERLKDNENIENTEYASFGKNMIPIDAVKAKSMVSYYKTMKVGDSINSKMKTLVTDVCQVKGCWMKLRLDDEDEVMVRFKDYGFFVPKDIKNKEVIVNGLAYVEELSVEDQHHYAKDAGKNPDDIARITEPKRIFAFEADGVLLKQ